MSSNYVQLIAIVLLGVGMTLAYINSDLTNRISNEEIAKEYSKILMLNKEIDKNMIELELFEYTNFDKITDNVDLLFNTLHGHVKKIDLVSDGTIHSDHALHLLSVKEEAINNLKSHVAVYRNFLNSYPKAYEKLILKFEKNGKINLLKSIYQDVIISIVIRNTDKSSLIEENLKKLQYIKIDQDIQNDTLEKFIIQTNKIIFFTKEIFKLQKDAEVHTFENTLQDYHSNYVKYYNNELRKANVYKFILFVTGSIILFLVILLIIKINRSEKNLQEALNEINFQKYALDEHAIVSMTDRAGNITYINKKFEEISQYKKYELLGKNHRIIKSDEHPKELFINMWKTIVSGEVWHGQIKNLKKDGSHYWVNSTIVPFVDRSGKPFKYISIRTDITDQKELQLNYQRAKEEAEKANKFKSEFLANMSHEIRTPMNGILGFVEHLAKGEKDTKRLKEFETIKNSGESLLHIINDILDFSKIESGKIDIESHPFEIDKLFENTINIFTQISNEKGVTLNKDIDNDLPTCIIGDQVRINQVVFNLLSNAIKFTSKGGSVTIRVTYNQKTTNMKLSIIDTGIGIAKENRSKIFDAFGQEDSSTTRRFGGTGLGLSISSKLLSMMGGELKVESELGKGSRFYSELPIRVCSEDELTKIDNDILFNHEQTQMSGYVLVVEDNKVNQMLMGIILEELGITYDIADDGVKAISMFQTKKYDVILMDENMPNMNGIEATKQLRNQEIKNNLKQTPIIAVTANAITEDRQRFLDAGMDDYISKPYTESDIREKLKKFLKFLKFV